MKIIQSIILSLLTLAVYGQVNDADAFFSGSYDRDLIHKHQIRQVIVEHYINKDKSSRYLFYFDKQGFLTKQTVFDSGGKLVNDYLFTYNKEGDQKDRTNINYSLNTSHTVSFFRTYVDSQLVQDSTSQFPYVTRHMYNNNKKRVLSTTYLGTDTTISARQILIYNYNAKGNLQTINEMYAEGYNAIPASIGTAEYSYNASDLVVVVTRKGKASYEMIYDNQGFLKTKTINLFEAGINLKIFEHYNYSFWE